MVLTAVLMAAALSATELKTDRLPAKDCFITEDLISDLKKDGFSVIRGDREVAKLYVLGLIQLGAPEPPGGVDVLTGILFVTTPKVPDKVIVNLVNADGQVCHSTIIPINIHDALMRGV